MQNIFYIIISIVLIMLASIGGVIFLQKTFKEWLDKNLAFLISFSAGVFLVIAIHLGAESLEILQSKGLVTFTIIGGALFFLALKLLWPESHHHEGECDEHEHDKPRAFRMMLGDAIHNIADGIIIVPAFAINLKLGIIAAVSIFIHELLQEISEFFVLKDSGYSTNEALIRNFLVSTTIIIGVVLGLFLTEKETVLGILLGIASGSFLYIVSVDLFPHKKMRKGLKHTITHLSWFIVGIIFIILLNTILGH